MKPRPQLLEVEARPQYRLFVMYADGANGEVDLSQVVGKGVFAAWNDQAAFESVRLERHGRVCWGDEIELCADALYLQLTGRTAEEIFPVSLSARLS